MHHVIVAIPQTIRFGSVRKTLSSLFSVLKKGHIVRACRKRGQSASAASREERKAKPGFLSTKWVDTVEAEEVAVQTVYVVHVDGDGPF